MSGVGAARIGTILAALLVLCDCGPSPSTETGAQADADPLRALLEQDRQRLGPVLDDPVAHRVQILYTRIDRDADGTPHFTDFGYRVNAEEYFYPASTVKLPTVLLALETLQRMQVPGLLADTPMFLAPPDPAAPETGASVDRALREIFAVSDNAAYNRLYDLLGQCPLNAALRAKGLVGARILHRLDWPESFEDSRSTPSVRFEQDGKVLARRPGQRCGADYRAGAPVLLGSGERIDGELLPGPKDFAAKNAYPLAALHATVRALVFPASVPPAKRFDLTPVDRLVVLQAMGGTPAESGLPQYADASEYPDGYVKFLIGGGTAARLPAGVRIFNKVGEAWGFLTDSAYIAEPATGVEFLLSATVYVNDDGVFNDDHYEYEQTGLPFLAELGRAVLEMERARPRAHRADLGWVRGMFPDRSAGRPAAP